MWCRLALVPAIMHPRVAPYITHLSDFSQFFVDLPLAGAPGAFAAGP